MTEGNGWRNLVFWGLIALLIIAGLLLWIQLMIGDEGRGLLPYDHKTY